MITPFWVRVEVSFLNVLVVGKLVITLIIVGIGIRIKNSNKFGSLKALYLTLVDLYGHLGHTCPLSCRSAGGLRNNKNGTWILVVPDI